MISTDSDCLVIKSLKEDIGNRNVIQKSWTSKCPLRRLNIHYIGIEYQWTFLLDHK